MAALKPSDKEKNYTDAELPCLRYTCSLTEAEMIKILPMFYKKLLSEGRKKRGTKAVLIQELCT